MPRSPSLTINLILFSAGRAQAPPFGCNSTLIAPSSFLDGPHRPPAEIAPCYVFLASEDSSFIAGQVLHPNGGTAVAG